jgi:hypothetical protein
LASRMSLLMIDAVAVYPLNEVFLPVFMPVIRDKT